MALTLSIDNIAETFPRFQVAVILASDLRIVPDRSDDLAALVSQREAECRQRFFDSSLSEIPGIAAWREAYRRFGIKKTSYRSSVERLVKNVLAERSLPAINSFVDCYNAVSLRHVMPVGADDADRIERSVAFRFSRDDDTFFPLGQQDPENDPPKPGEVVLAAGSNILCRRWNWYQDARSPITERTERALVTIQAHGVGDLAAAADDLVDLLARFCAAKCQVATATAQNPNVEFSDP